MSQLESIDFPTHTAHFHMVNRGAHSEWWIEGLARPTISTVLATTDIRYPTDGSPTTGLAWIDFPRSYPGDGWFDKQLAITYLPLDKDPREAKDFMSAGVMVATILRHRVEREPKWRMSHGHKEIMQSFYPAEPGELRLDYMRQWLPDFRRMDRPHPPKEPASTDVIRLLAAMLPYMQEH